ncbi:hypothetical protein [Brachybacterium muris]|uniref:Uncharacterized protein n=1 Tax=Brachybacterium muris UCD-AY4 TaxID=1249481 RepID=A0A022KWJ1_9MICO|nr:hypothetical protein [Brachybacterium muris]EYT49207.1 hypothetical protein D641_0109515 [Brachybacterium muris UCD-AY4]MCT1653453.1 hypothetical protein [Brachybacterium muris]
MEAVALLPQPRDQQLHVVAGAPGHLLAHFLGLRLMLVLAHATVELAQVLPHRSAFAATVSVDQLLSHAPILA